MYKKEHIHFIGIGGIGMSGIAYVLQLQGYKVSGCDIDLDQLSIQNLKKIGCSIYHGNNTPDCNDQTIDILVYSSAIGLNNAEIKRAQESNIITVHRALMLSELMRTKFSIAVSGAHGKTTTSSLISHLLIESDMDPTVIVGGYLENISSNAKLGSGNFLVAEADESDKSFLKLNPTIALATNIDLEHLDNYKDLEDIRINFRSFLSNLPFYGKAVICTDDPHLKALPLEKNIKTIRYGTDINNSDLCALDIVLDKYSSTFNVYSANTKSVLGKILLPLSGKHNVLNALGALTVALELGVPFELLSKAISTFKGVDRRFSFRGKYKGAAIYDDYGHHPTEIYNTLLVAKKATSGKLTVIFQPQRYSRTEKLWQEFINVFAHSEIIDNLIITDIYPASEQPIEGIDSYALVEAIKQKQPSCLISYISGTNDFEQIKNKLENIIQAEDLLLFLGAGKVNKLIKQLK